MPAWKSVRQQRGAVLGHYRIVEKIGEGGMGLVYRSHDERLDRDVAVKVLPPGAFADEAARKRFRKEALALSKLNHPNIATVHDFDSQESTDFLVEELIPGQSLDAMLATGPLPEREIINLETQLCDGLAAAHEQGIIHRDLKPGNIRVTPDARLKILDFGLAKVLRSAAAGTDTEATASLTETHTVSGTLPYMAPEQLLDEKLDARTDIWAAGCVLYEMATGRRPFRASGAALTDSILHQPPASPFKLNHKVAPGLEAIILKCLKKNPALRYASARDIAVDLQRLRAGTVTKGMVARRRGRTFKGTVAVLVIAAIAGATAWFVHRRSAPATGEIRSIAVLPLAKLSDDPEQQYFADGMTEELINALGKIRAMRVISRQSVMRYKDTQKELPEIADELNVDAVLEGTVLHSHGRVRISVQLIQARPERHLWAQSYERDMQDVLALQSEIARGVAGGIRATLTPQDQARLTMIRRVEPNAEAAYFRGRFFINRWPASDFIKCEDYLKEATQKDPSYAEAYAALAFCYTLMSWSHPPREIFPKVKVAALRSIQIDDGISEAHFALANAKVFFDWEWPAAENEVKQAIDLNPSNPWAHACYANLLLFLEHYDDAITEAQKAVELDPASLLTNRNLTFVYSMAHRYEDALLQSKVTLALDPANEMSQFDTVTAYVIKGDMDHARADAKRFGFLEHPLFGLFLATSETRKAALAKFDAYVTATAPRPYIDAFFIASSYAYLQEKERALKSLDKAYEDRSAMMVQIKVNPLLNELRSDQHFQELVRRMNFPP